MDTAPPAVVTRARELVEHPEDADPFVAIWLRRFAAVADRALRRTVLADLLAETDDGSLLGVLARIDARAANGEAACRALVAELALTPSVLNELPYERITDLYSAARVADLPRLSARFLGTRGDGKRVDPRNPHLDTSAGARTSAARSVDRLVLDRLLHDRDPRVIRVLLDNPRITERDVVRIAAMRPTSTAILELIASHLRWGQGYRVRKTLAFNPATPFSLAAPLLPTLLRQHLAELASSQVLTPELRAEVAAVLASRTPRRRS
ncbi:MAG: hypothetical protein Q8P18_25145 [Pseudomonadota bacterium]|nr:hypothetical protein [Pseudomonadota bacterium]